MKNPTATIKVAVNKDINGIVYDCVAIVEVTNKYSIKDVILADLQAFDQNDEHVEPEMSEETKNQLELLAGSIALERISSSDFESEE